MKKAFSIIFLLVSLTSLTSCGTTSSCSKKKDSRVPASEGMTYLETGDGQKDSEDRKSGRRPIMSQSKTELGRSHK